MPKTVHVSGGFRFFPHASWEEIKRAGFSTCGDRLDSDGCRIFRADDVDMRLLVKEDKTETDTGHEVTLTADLIEMPEIFDYRERSLIEQVQKVVDLFPGRSWIGEIVCVSEHRDFWRVYIDHNNQVVREDSVTFFPSDLLTKIVPFVGRSTASTVVEMAREASHHHKEYPW